MNTKETRIDETLAALDGIKRAPAPPGLLKKLTAIAEHPGSKTVSFRRPYYWSVAAGIALLISLNVMGALYYHHNQNITREVPVAVAKDYLSYLGPIKL